MVARQEASLWVKEVIFEFRGEEIHNREEAGLAWLRPRRFNFISH